MKLKEAIPSGWSSMSGAPQGGYSSIFKQLLTRLEKAEELTDMELLNQTIGDFVKHATNAQKQIAKKGMKPYQGGEQTKDYIRPNQGLPNMTQLSPGWQGKK